MQLYIEGYLQAMLDTLYKQEYLTVRVIDNQVIELCSQYVCMWFALFLKYVKIEKM